VSFNPFSLAGKRILVTGGSSGIGREIAMTAARMGAEVIAAGRDGEKLGAAKAELAVISSLNHQIISADLTNPDELSRAVSEISNPLDGIVHSAGISRLAPFRQLSLNHLRQVLSINLEAPLVLTQKLLARNFVNKNGSILFISSIAAHIGVPGVAAYSASKAALIAGVRCLAMEVAKHKIRANCLSPAIVDTDILTATVSIKGVEGTNRLEDEYPLGFGTTADVANASVYFLSDASRWVTGTTLIMDGGLTVR
jgi:NAD(P)-dependent dehydrogenase (short-subunit alcohol dehydrogenase family)